MKIKTTMRKDLWYRELKSMVEPSLKGIVFSTYVSDDKYELIQVELNDDTDSKKIMIMKLKGDNGQDILNGIAAYAQDNFGLMIRGFKVNH
jgi:hypothetical protein